jgi:hypothetical protein
VIDLAGIYDAVDIRWTWNGDLNLGHDGDLQDTSTDVLVSLIQDIHNICASALNDWELYPNLGAGLDDFVGEPNVRSRADMIHDRLRLALTTANVVQEDDLKIRVVPVHRHKVMILLMIAVTPTIDNQLSSTTNRLKTAFVFDFVEQGMLFFDRIPQLLAT